MKKIVKLAVIVSFMVLILSSLVGASPHDPYLILEGEHASLVGNSLKIGNDNDVNYVTVEQGFQSDLMSLMVDMSSDNIYEFWLRLKGTSSAQVTMYDSTGRRVMKTDLTTSSNTWHWVEMKNTERLTKGRYYFVLSDFTGLMSVDKVIIKKSSKQRKQESKELGFSIQATGSSTPLLPTDSPWTKQGINPFTSIFQSGNEYVSSTSALLTISATDLSVPGRGGLDLNISRYYNSPAYSGSESQAVYMNLGGWEFGLPRATVNSLSLETGSECNLDDDEVRVELVTLPNKDKKYTYTNSVNTYFKLIRYERYTGDILFIPQYETDHYELYMANGNLNYFNKDGKILYVQGKNPNNKIQYEYDAGGNLIKITDTLGHVYNLNRTSNQIEIVRAEDGKVMVSYNYSGSTMVVKDALSRATTYTNSDKGITQITYPSGKISKYEYSAQTPDGYVDSIYWVSRQQIFAANTSIPVKQMLFTPNFSDVSQREINYVKIVEYDENNVVRSESYDHVDTHGMLVRTKQIDKQKNKVARTVYVTYDINKQKIKESVYDGNIYEATFDQAITAPEIAVNQRQKDAQWLITEEEWAYDKWGNMVYYKDPEGYETMVSFVNSDYNTMFYRVGSGNGTAAAFYDNSAMANTTVNNLPSGELKISKYLDPNRQTFEASETYYLYDAQGNLIESKALVRSNDTNNWVKNKYLDYDQYGNCRKKVLDADSLAPITETYEFDTTHYAYMTSRTQYVSKNLVDDSGNAIAGKYSKTIMDYDYKTGKLITVTDPRSRVVRYEYDALGRPTKVFYPKLSTESEPAYDEIVYNELNHSMKVYDTERKMVTVVYYDGLGRTIKEEKYSDMNCTTLVSSKESVYNWQDNVKIYKDENGKVTLTEYDTFGRITNITTPDGNVTTSVYDDLLGTMVTTNAKNKRETNYFDRKGQKTQEIKENQGLNWIYLYQYDGFGNIIKTTDAKGQEVGYEYDNFGRLTKIKYPDLLGKVYDIHDLSLTDSYLYDGKGNTIQFVNRKGEIIKYQYNEYNLLTKVDLPSSPDIDYFYNEVGQLIKVVENNNYIKQYGYDERGRQVKESLTVNPNLSTQKKYETQYSYNKNNAVTTLSYPSSAGTVTYLYNTLNQIANVKWGTTDIAKNFNYTKTGQLAQLTFGNGVIGSYNYSNVNGKYVTDNIAYSLGSRQLGVYDFRYDKLGNIVRANNQQYEYDDLNQLVGWKYLQENNQVLIGEQVIWNKQMIDQMGLNLSQTAVSNNRMELAIAPNQAIVDVSRLLTQGQVTSSSNVEVNNNSGYNLTRSRLSNTEDFKNVARINTTLTTASINYTAGVVSLPETSTATRWENVLNQQPNFSLQKSATSTINTVLGSISPNYRYTGFDCENGDSWVPTESSGLWEAVPYTLVLSTATMKDVKTLRLDLSAIVYNSFNLLGGLWGDWTTWIKFEINQVPVGITSIISPAADEKVRTAYVDVNLVSEGLFNNPQGLTVKMFLITNKTGAGATLGGSITSLTATGLTKAIYPVNQEAYQQYSIASALYKGINYKLEATATVPTGTSLRYELWSSTAKVATLTNNAVFTVSNDGTYYVRAYMSTTNAAYTPTLSTIKVSREKKYVASAVVQTNMVTLAQSTRSIALDYTSTSPSGTNLAFAVSNNNGTTWVTPTFNSDINKYVANFTTAGSQIITKATLHTDSLQRYTPTLQNLKVTAWDTGIYSTSGYVVNQAFSVTEPSKSIIMELHGKKNGGSIEVTMTVNGINIPGVPTTSEEIVSSGGDGDENGTDTGGTLPGEDPDPALLTLANELRAEIANKNLSTYYYKFSLPDNIASSAFNGTITIKMYPDSGYLNTPNVYSYILLYNRLYYYSAGSFTTATNGIPTQTYSFDQVRLTVNGQNLPSGTANSFEVYLPGSANSTVIVPGTVVNLPTDTNTVQVKGNFTTTNPQATPSLTGLTVTAIGETLFKNSLEATTDVSSSVTSTLSVNSDRVEGNYSLVIDHTSTGISTYTMNGTQIFDATKLPIIQVWVKPITDYAISFSSYDVKEGRDERITSDFDGDGYFEIGQDLIKDKWNLILLDLRRTNSSGIAKDAKGLKLLVNYMGTKVMIDGVSTLPLNQTTFVYDKAGNRAQTIENGLVTTYIYTTGSNRLERRYNALEDISYTYDEKGNLTRQDVTSNGVYYWFSYVFNELNQLVKVSKNGSLIAEYSYDNTGLRYKKVDYTTNQTTFYVYGNSTEPIYEEIYNNSNLTTPITKTSYLNIGSKRIGKADASGVTYFFVDQLGSTRIVMDSAGVCSYYEYKPYGGDLGSTSSERYKFTGKEDDGATGLYYYNARYYDPAIGRFISQDAARDKWNWYVYCLNNPLILIDPTGLLTDPLETMKIRRGLKNHTFGWVRRTTTGAKKAHQGIDLYAPEGTPIKAIADGTVVAVNTDADGWGKYIVVKFETEAGEVLYAMYAHLSEVDVKVNEKVTEGEIIGETGTSGNAAGMTGEDEHLHFEIWTHFYPDSSKDKLNDRMDPQEVLPAFTGEGESSGGGGGGGGRGTAQPMEMK